MILQTKNNICLHNPETEITKTNPHFKNTVSIVIKQITPSLLASKNNEMMKTNEMLTLDQNLLRNHLNSTFVLLPMIEQSDMIQDIEVEVHHEIIITTKIIFHTLEKINQTIKKSFNQFSQSIKQSVKFSFDQSTI